MSIIVEYEIASRTEDDHFFAFLFIAVGKSTESIKKMPNGNGILNCAKKARAKKEKKKKKLCTEEKENLP
ncbi:hypothetical protein PGB90_002813 [Kerria lacca]